MLNTIQKTDGWGRRIDPAAHVRLHAAERRRHRRGEIHLHAVLRYESEVFVAQLTDISAGGAQLRCSLVPRLGAMIEMETEEFGSLSARVVRRLPRSLAVEFEFQEVERMEFTDRLDGLLNPDD